MLCYYDILSKQNILSTITDALLHSSAKINKEVFQNLLAYLNGTVASTFKECTDGCTDQPLSPGFADCGGRSGVSSTIFVVYSNNLPLKHYH